MEYVFIEENSGIGKNSGKPYHLLKLADPITFENHLISYDPITLSPQDFVLQKGTKIKIEGRLSTPYQNTQFLCTSIKKVG